VRRTFTIEGGHKIRQCSRCHRLKPLTNEHFYEERATGELQHRCIPCQGEVARARPSCCHRCHVRKPADAYPRRERRSSVCWSCWEEEAWAYYAVVERRRKTWINPKNGRRVRRCCECGKVKDLRRSFYRQRAASPGKVAQYARICKACFAVASAEAYRARREDPEQVERERAASRAASKRYRERHLQKARAASNAWKRRVYADPVRRAQILEDHRINYRLKRQREGLKVREHGAKNAVRQPDPHRRLPVKPLTEYVVDVFKLPPVQSRHRSNGVVTEAAEKLGVTVRTLYRWRTDDSEHVPVGVAERAVMALGIEFEALWPEAA
jgi:hypothetical protein